MIQTVYNAGGFSALKYRAFGFKIYTLEKCRINICRERYEIHRYETDFMEITIATYSNC